MKRILLLVTGLLCSLVTSAQLATQTKPGLVIPGTGLTISNGVLSVIPGAITPINVSTLTRDAVQAAVNSVSGNAIIYLPDGTLTGFDTNPVTIAGKTNLTLQGTKKTNFTATNASAMILVNGDFDGLTIDGINFRNTATTGGGNGQILVNEQGTAAGKKNLKITNCKFRAPNFRINAVTFSLYSAIADQGSGTGYPLTGFLAQDLDIDSMGRCGLELVAHNWNDNKTAVMMNDYHINRCKIRHTGRIAETNGIINGMAVSISGYAISMHTTNCYVEDARLLGIEYAGVTDGTIKGNTLTNPGSVTYVGISLSDNSHNFNRNDIIDGNYVNTKNKPMSINQGYGHIATNNTFIQQVATTDGGSVYIQDSNYITIYGGVINGNSYNPLRIDNSSYCRIGGRLTITNDASPYALVSIYGNAAPAAGSVGNTVETNVIFYKQGTLTTSGVVETIGNAPNTTGSR